MTVHSKRVCDEVGLSTAIPHNLSLSLLCGLEKVTQPRRASVLKGKSKKSKEIGIVFKSEMNSYV